MRVFHRFGDYEHRSRNRLKFTIKALGWDGFRQRYEDALAALTSVDMPEAQQYKALCLLALGRTQDATGAVEMLVTAQPTFEPSAQDVPPRFVTLVSDAKRKLLPALARRAFNEGREQFRNGSREEALVRFNLVMTLTSDPSFKESADAEDLRTLASGFIDLAKATAPPPVPAPAVAAKAPEPPPVEPPAVVQPIVLKQYIPPVPAEVGTQGNPAVSVRVVIEERETNDPSVTQVIETTVGQPLSMAAVRESISHLFSLGLAYLVLADDSHPQVAEQGP